MVLLDNPLNLSEGRITDIALFPQNQGNRGHRYIGEAGNVFNPNPGQIGQDGQD